MRWRPEGRLPVAWEFRKRTLFFAGEKHAFRPVAVSGNGENGRRGGKRPLLTFLLTAFCRLKKGKKRSFQTVFCLCLSVFLS